MKKRTRQTMSRFRIRVIAFVIVFAMALSVAASMPMDVFAEGQTSGKCGDNLTWNFNKSTGTLTISGTGDMWEEKEWNPEDDDSEDEEDQYHYPWTEIDDEIKNIVLEENVTSIGYQAFYGYDIVSIDIPASVNRIDASAFVCECSLKNINVDNNNQYYTSRDGVLYNKSMTKLVRYPGGKELSKYTIPSTVTTIGKNAFSYCWESKLEYLFIPNSVKVIEDNAFEACGIEKLVLPNSVEVIGKEAFCWCESFKGEFVIPDSVKSIGHDAFNRCFFESVIIGDGLSTIPENMFVECFYLKSVKLGKSVKHIKRAAFIDLEITSIDLPDSLITIGEGAFAGCDLKSLAIPNSVTTIDEYAFQNCSEMTNITISKSVTSIGDGAFDQCSKLKDVYYTGSEDAWKKITIGNENEPLVDASKHYKFMEPDDSEIIREKVVEIKFRSDTKKAKQTNRRLTHSFYYNDKFFYYNNKEYHNDLAVMSLGLDLASWSTSESDGNYKIKFEGSLKNIRAGYLTAVYNELGFIDANYYNYDLPLNVSDDKAAYSFALKYIVGLNGKVDTLIAVAIRGGGYGAEWVSNFNVGTNGDHSGFSTSAQEVYNNLKQYIAAEKSSDKIKGELKIWNVGYSRGAAISNILGHLINKNKLVPTSDLYTYTFATPRGYMKDANNTVDDSNIFNIVSVNDIVPKLACEKWNFGRYGNSMGLPTYNPKTVSKAFSSFTDEELPSYSNYGLEETVMDALTQVAPTRKKYYDTCQQYIIDELKADYSDKEGEFATDLIVGIAKSDNKNGKKILAALGVVGYTDNFWENLADSVGALGGRAAQNITALKETVKLGHYAEHYLAWLETGGQYGLNITGKSQYAGLTDSKRKTIEDSIIREFNVTCYDLHIAACPVDVNVYDSSNNLVVSIVNNEIIVDELPCSVEDDVKYIFTFDDEYRFEFIGNDTGTMDYQVQEFNSDSEVVRTVNHYDVALTKGKHYTEQVKNSILDGTNTYVLTTDSNIVKPVYDSMNPVGSKHNITFVNGGSMTESAYQNECVKIFSEEIEGKKFSHWTSDVGDGIFNDAKSEVTNFVMPNTDVKITAVFVDSTILGDLNNDGIVNAKDSALLSAAFGKRQGNSGYNEAADFNNDGIINAKDKAIISANFGKRK